MTLALGRLPLLLGALAAAALAPRADAQGTLSTQGYGYPLGQVSARARAAGHAVGELDPFSPINPAALAAWGDPALYFEYLPERRTVTLGAVDAGTLTSRFPLVAAALRVRSDVTIGVSASTLLDRTWETSFDTTLALASGPFTFTQRHRVAGAINDVRLAAAWAPHASVRFGLGGHVLSGESRLRTDILGFDQDTAGVPIGALAVQNSTVSYSGLAVSGGVELRASGVFSIGASGRMGGRLKTWSGDTLLRAGDSPARVSGALVYNGLAGTVLAVRAAWEGWSSLAAATLSADAHDTWSLAAGAELRGFRWFGRQLPVRAGVQRRTLPFSAPGTGQARELGFAAGVGIPLASERARIDLVAEYDRRRAESTPATESGLLFGIGFTVRP